MLLHLHLNPLPCSDNHRPTLHNLHLSYLIQRIYSLIFLIRKTDIATNVPSLVSQHHWILVCHKRCYVDTETVV